MATQLFLQGPTGDYQTGAVRNKFDGVSWPWFALGLNTSRGAAELAYQTTGVVGPTSGVEVCENGNGSTAYWVSAPLAAQVTVSGSVTWNIWARESAMTANVAINGELSVIDGATGAITVIDKTARVTELPLTAAAQNFAKTPAAGVVCKKGDRIRVVIFGDDAGTMSAASPDYFTIGFAGPTAAASGDTYVTLTENLTFAAEPAGTQLFLTDTASAVSTASVDREAWTSRGAGVVDDVTNTAAGNVAPIQITDTAGGTVVDWFTRPLQAFTLGDAVRCNLRGLESNAAANAAIAMEIAVVNGDGTGAVVWGQTSFPVELAITETDYSFLVSAENVSVTAGQRLRLRVQIDDCRTLATGHTITTYYAGSSGATGDAFVTLSQSVTENIVIDRVPRSTPYPQLLAH